MKFKYAYIEVGKMTGGGQVFANQPSQPVHAYFASATSSGVPVWILWQGENNILSSTSATAMNLFCRLTRQLEPHEYEKIYGKKHFPFRGLSMEEQMEFWESCRTLLLSRGYHLYKPASGPCH